MLSWFMLVFLNCVLYVSPCFSILVYYLLYAFVMHKLTILVLRAVCV